MISGFRLFAFVLSFFFLFACTNITTEANGGARIQPEECTLTPFAEITLSLNAILPLNATIVWQASGGYLVRSGTGYTATYIAPERPGIYRITVLIEEAGKDPYYLASLECLVSPLTPTALPSLTPILTEVVASPTFTITPPSPATPTATAPSKRYTLAITEFMGNPCGNSDEIALYNQYIELYNYGQQPVDISGLWLYNGISQRIIPWDMHYPKLPPLGGKLITSSTIIPPGGFALILSPLYPKGPVPYYMPYSIPDKTVILTVEDTRLGGSKYGIIGHGSGRQVLVLYRGGKTVIEKVISTYGTPFLDTFVEKIRDDYRDALPLDLPRCRSANLRTIEKGDTQSNWELIYRGTPGEGPYQPLP
ncbi:MAG: lamin tail domain-containing protein [Anaerolineales bacterium]